MMDDNRSFWNEVAPAAMSDAGSQPDSTISPTLGAVEHADRATHTTNSYDSVVSLHPDVRLALVESLHGDAGSANNLCILVGTVTREYQRNRRGSGQNTLSQGAENARTVRTPLGMTESMLRLEVQEVWGDGLNTALTSYSMPLYVSAKLAATGVFVDGQRVAISGPLRMERTYDLRFAMHDLDPGLPAWTLRLDAVGIQPLAEDSDILDGSWVQLEGEIEAALTTTQQ